MSRQFYDGLCTVCPLTWSDEIDKVGLDEDCENKRVAETCCLLERFGGSQTASGPCESGGTRCADHCCSMGGVRCA